MHSPQAHDESGSGDRRRMLLALGGVLLLHAPVMLKPLFDSDEAIYAAVGALVDGGGRLYAEGGVDNKFPGIYYTYAAVFRVFGTYSMGAVHGLAVLVVLGTCLLLGEIARRIGGNRAAWMTALFYGALTTFYYPKMLAANTELFMTLPLAASVLLALPRSSREPARAPALFFSGALIGVATLYRQLAGLNLLLSCGVPLLIPGGRGRLSRVFASTLPVLGFGAVAGGLLGAYAVNGNLPDFLHWAVGAATTRYLRVGWTYHWPIVEYLSMLGVMIVPVTLALLRARRSSPAPVLERVIVLWLAVGVAAIVFLWRFHPHYVIHAVAPLSILSALELAARTSEGSAASRRWVARLTFGPMAVLSAVFAVLAVVLEPVAGGFYPPKPDYPEVARYVRENTREGERIFVWGAYAPIYVLSGRLPATRFVGFMRGCPRAPDSPLSRCWDSGPEAWPLLARDLEATPPELLLDTAAANYGDFALYPMKDVPVLASIVGSRYVEEATVDGVRIYRRAR